MNDLDIKEICAHLGVTQAELAKRLGVSERTVMPNEIFDALELASLKGETETDVDKALFTQMVDNYKKKMALCER